MKNESSRVLGVLLSAAVALASIISSGHAQAQDRGMGRLAPQRTTMTARETPAAVAQKRTSALDRREPTKPAQVKRLDPAPARAPVDRLQQTRSSKARARR